MKKAVLHSIMALVVVLGLTLSMATPVGATVNMVADVDLLWTTQRGTLHYTITVTNTNPTDSASYTVTFFPPGPTGAEGEYGDLVPIDTNRTIAGGDTVTYTWDGDGVTEARPELKVELPEIPIDDDVNVVYALVTFEAGGAGDGEKALPTGVIWPDTRVTITSSPPTVSSGGSVILTVTEENTGDVDLTNPYVEIWKNDDAHLTTLEAPPDTGDVGDPGVLNVGETWTWEYDSGPITSTTTFVALGFGTAPHDLEVKYAEGFEGERAEVTIQVDRVVGGVASPVRRLALLVPWIVLAGLIAGAAVFVWSRRAQGRA